MPRSLTLALTAGALFVALAPCSKAASIQLEIANYTASAGDPVFDVASDVSFRGISLLGRFSGGSTALLPLFDRGTPTTILDTTTLLLDTAQIASPGVNGTLVSVTLTGSLSTTALQILNAFGGMPVSAVVLPNFTAVLNGFTSSVNVYAIDASSGAQYGIGTLSPIVTASATPEPGGFILLAGSGLLLLLCRKRIRRTIWIALSRAGRVAFAGFRPALAIPMISILVGPAPAIFGQRAPATAITTSNWGAVTAPVFGSSETGAYSGTELFAGPNKFGSYYSGVLPNGRIVKPAGTSIQIGMNPLGIALTPDGRFVISSNDNEREGGLPSLQSGVNIGGYSLSVVDTQTMSVVSQFHTGATFFIGLQATGTGPYTVWASGGPNNGVNLFALSSAGVLSAATPAIVTVAPILPNNAGYVSNYTPGSALNTADPSGNKPPVPSGFSRTTGAQITFPAGSALSPDGKFLYVACNGDNSVAVIDTNTRTVLRQVPVGRFPYGVAVSALGAKVAVSNWGIMEYKFAKPSFDASGNLTAVGTTGPNTPDGFYVPPTNTVGSNPQTSSVSLLNAPGGNGAALSLLGSVYEGHPLDNLNQVGDTHPSAIGIVRSGSTEVLYVTKSNSDSLGLILLNNNRKLPDFDLSAVSVPGLNVHGSYPNALVVSHDNTRTYVAEAGLNSVAVLDTTNPVAPKLLGRLGTGWYPTALAISNDGNTLYVANAKGIGEDINPKTIPSGAAPPTGLASFPQVDSNYIFGSLQKIDLTSQFVDNTTVLSNNYSVNSPADTSIVPAGGGASPRIKHVFFILHENKTFDSMLGGLSGRFGKFSSLTYNDLNGAPYNNVQYTGVDLNTQTLATKFSTAVNYYSDSEESDAGHQFAASGTSSDYTQKTLLVKSGRGLLVNKNFEPEDYPEGGYIFNNAARKGVSFKDYGALVRIEGTDTGTSTPAILNDPPSGLAGYPQLDTTTPTNIANPLVNKGDVTSKVQGLGQSYFMSMPILEILGEKNANGEPHLDLSYPGYNFNISDQRRALEFISDFDRMAAAGTLPQFIYIYQPNDHTGGVQASNAAAVGTSPLQQVADGDVGLGMVVNHIMKSPVYYDAATGDGSAIFITYDDAQSSLDHIHPHRTPLVVVSPYARPGYTATRHYVTASIVKTEELLLGLPPNNLGDLFATDLRDMFQPTYNGVTAADVPVTRLALNYQPSPEGKRIWSLAKALDTSAPDRDSKRLGALARLSIAADQLQRVAAEKRQLRTRSYRRKQAVLYKAAAALVAGPPPRDTDG